jgi:thiol-disulfide isomerase/thioredoxin
MRYWLPLLVIFSLLPACGRVDTSALPTESSTTQSASDPRDASDVVSASDLADAPPAADSPVTLDVKSWDETMEFVQTRAGQVVVIDLWSTWCGPCKREFPGLVKLQQRYPDRVTCISFSLDYEGLPDQPPETFREGVLAFLNEQHATLVNVLGSDASDEIYERLQLGAIPAVLVYDQTGDLVKRFDNDDSLYGDEGFTYEQHVAPLVESLLDGQDP